LRTNGRTDGHSEPHIEIIRSTLRSRPKKVNESIGPFKKHASNKIAVIIITRFSSKCQIVSTSSKVID